jgi:MFS transporter, UMF1 family
MSSFSPAQRAWIMYDWANSAHALVIVSAIFPVYYESVIKNISTNPQKTIDIFGMMLSGNVLFSYTVALSFLVAVFLHPFLSVLADESGRKKAFMRFFVLLGGFSTLLLFFFTKENLFFSMLLLMLSLIGFSGSLVFYNAFLPEISQANEYDNLSAKGYMWGYVGSVLLMVQNLTMLLMPQFYGGISEGLACRISFLTVGIWWLIFGLYALYFLPKDNPKKVHNFSKNVFKKIAEIRQEVRNNNNLQNFLWGFFFYNMGLQTVMYIAGIFGESELKIKGGALIVTILLVQLLAIVGAYFFAFFSKKYGNVNTIFYGIFLWIGVCLSAYFINQTGFFVLAIVIGLLMGGMQSLSRATFAKFLPENTPKRNAYFAYYEITDKLGIVLGTFSYGFIAQLTGSVRNSVVALAVYFLVGSVFLFFLKREK